MTHSGRRKQQGMSMVTVIFLLVVLASAAAFIVQITQLQQAGAALRMLEARAYQLALTGVERGKYHIYHEDGAQGCSPSNYPKDIPISFTKEDDPLLVNFNLVANVNCHKTTDNIANWTVVSVATFREPGDPLHVNRAVKVHFSHGI